MRVAIPEHLGRVAPVFDCCRRVLVVVQTKDTEEQVAEEDWSAVSRIARPARLRELIVDLLICGGISCWMEDQIHRTGIRLIPWVAGEVGNVLTALRKGSISHPCYLMPGRGRCARRRQSGPCAGHYQQLPSLPRKGA
jgi:predicted Fe-Mo cluster-binding NifX family protein